MKCRKTIWSLLGASVLVGSAAASPAPAAPAAAGPLAAQVNDEKIPMSDVDRIFNTIKVRNPNLALTTPEALVAAKQARQQILDNLITRSLLYQDAQHQKIVPAQGDVDKAMQEFRKGFTNDQEFQTALQQEGKTTEDLQRIITEELSIRELTNRLTGDLVVSEEEMARFYRNNPKEFMAPEAVHARHILFAADDKATPQQKKAALERAKAALKRLKSGTDFGALAKEVSDDPATKEQGGDLGAFTRGEMVKPFEDAAFKTDEGKIAGPIESPFGYHLIKVEEKRAPTQVPLEGKIKEVVKSFLLKQKVQDKLDQRLSELKQKATIKTFL